MTTYTGVTRLLKKPIEVNGKMYPFGYDSDMPDHLHTSYRLMVTSDPDALTDAALSQMIGCSRRQRLEADMEKTEGRPLVWITIHPESSNTGTSGNGGEGGRRVQLEKGPDLEIHLAPPRIEPRARQVKLPNLLPDLEIEMPPPRRATKLPPPIEMDMF